MDFSKEQIHKDRESPEKDIVYPVCHRVGVLGFAAFGRQVLMNLFFGRRHDGKESIDRMKKEKEEEEDEEDGV